MSRLSISRAKIDFLPPQAKLYCLFETFSISPHFVSSQLTEEETAITQQGSESLLMREL